MSIVREEALLRLAEIASMLRSVKCDEDGQPMEDLAGLLSALDYALRGDPGCIEPSDWQADRRVAFVAQRNYIGLGGLS
jgi:predicted trehalose synthase